MLPKPEKPSKKNSQSSEQLDFVESISAEDKVKKKRRSLIFFLCITIGISLAFWTYRSVKSMFAAHQYPQINFNLPAIHPDLSSMSVTKPANLGEVVAPFIKKDPNHWSIYVEIPENHYKWSQNLNLTDIDIKATQNELLKQLPSGSSVLSGVLPSGVEVRQLINRTGVYHNYYFLLTIPKKRIYLLYQVSGNSGDSLDAAVSELSGQIYWYLLQSQD
ncbi:MAG TPA: hypothetical protein VF828_03960 [Patescibacteria group bacterium]